MDRKQRSETDLRAASDCLYYEIQMLLGTMKFLETEYEKNIIRDNALVESFTIHARALIHFLYPSGKIAPEDILAEDYFETGHWEKIRPDEPERFKTARRRVNKEIAHLSYQRLSLTPEDKVWHPVLGGEIINVLNFFLTVIPKQLIGSRWEKSNLKNRSDTEPVQLAINDNFISDVSTSYPTL